MARVRPRHASFAAPGPGGLHRLHYIEWGDRRNPNVVVCAHGYSGNARDFDALAQSLAPDARVICIDFPGRGESDWLATPLEYHFGQFLADIGALLVHVGARRVDWFDLPLWQVRYQGQPLKERELDKPQRRFQVEVRLPYSVDPETPP